MGKAIVVCSHAKVYKKAVSSDAATSSKQVSPAYPPDEEDQNR